MPQKCLNVSLMNIVICPKNSAPLQTPDLSRPWESRVLHRRTNSHTALIRPPSQRSLRDLFSQQSLLCMTPTVGSLPLSSAPNFFTRSCGFSSWDGVTLSQKKYRKISGKSPTISLSLSESVSLNTCAPISLPPHVHFTGSQMLQSWVMQP